jgi:hypothetical protein
VRIQTIAVGTVGLALYKAIHRKRDSPGIS